MNRYPAFYYGLAAVAGVALAYGVWPPLFLVLFGTYRIQKIGFICIALFLCIETIYFMPVHPDKKVNGVGYYEIEKVKRGENSLIYFGKMRSFATRAGVYSDIPCTFFRRELLDLSSDYIVQGTISKSPSGFFTFFPSKFETVPYTKNLSHLRFQWKEKFRNQIKSHVKDETCAAFFTSLATGEISDRLLGMQFNKVGLTHTLAISGFHYAWLVCILGAFFHLFFSKRTTAYFLIIVISLYFLFIGETPSLNRAWLAAIIYLIGYLIKEPVNGLNSLGVALLISLILDPFTLKEIGFQLSYLATFAILTIHPIINHFLKPFFPKRKIFCLSSLISLNVAVHLTTLPLLLYHFHYFPYLSLFFNLFFPLAITVPMIALILSPLPYIGPLVLPLAEWYTTPFLNTIFYGVDALDQGLSCRNLPLDLLVALLIAIFLLTRISHTMYDVSHQDGGSSSVG